MARTLDDVYREVLWRTSLTTNDYPYIYTSGGAYGFLQTFHDVYTRLIREIASTGSDHFMEKSTFVLQANQQEYIFPDDLLKLRQIELSYGGDSRWARALERDLSHLPQMTEAATLSAASTSYPLFDILENSFFIYPEPKTMVSGGKFWYIKMPAEGMYISAISAASATFTFPQEYERLLPLGCEVELWGKYEAPQTNPSKIQMYEAEIENMKKKIKPRSGGGQKRMVDFREQGGGSR